MHLFLHLRFVHQFYLYTFRIIIATRLISMRLIMLRCDINMRFASLHDVIDTFSMTLINFLRLFSYVCCANANRPLTREPKTDAITEEQSYNRKPTVNFCPSLATSDSTYSRESDRYCGQITKPCRINRGRLNWRCNSPNLHFVQMKCICNTLYLQDENRNWK